MNYEQILKELRTDKDLFQLDKKAEKENRSRNNLIENIIKEYFNALK